MFCAKLLVFALALAVVQADVIGDYLPGSWKEDSTKRQNLNNFLYYRGLNWFKRVYVTNTFYENTMHVTKDGNKFSLSGLNGPREEEYQFDLIADNQSLTKVDLGQLGGMTDARVEIIGGNKLVTYLYDPSGKHIVTATRMINPINTDILQYNILDVESNETLESTYKRQ